MTQTDTAVERAAKKLKDIEEELAGLDESSPEYYALLIEYESQEKFYLMLRQKRDVAINDKRAKVFGLVGIGVLLFTLRGWASGNLEEWGLVISFGISFTLLKYAYSKLF